MPVVTNLGDSAVTGAFALLLAVYLLVMRQGRAAAAIIVVWGLTALVVAVGKITLYSHCIVIHRMYGLKSPSGHSAMSLAVYGTCAALIASSMRGVWRILPYLVVAPLVGLIAVSRVALAYHTLGDIIIGLTMGAVVSLGVWYGFMSGRVVTCRWWPFALIALVVIGALYGAQFPAEDIIELLSNRIRHTFHTC